MKTKMFYLAALAGMMFFGSTSAQTVSLSDGCVSFSTGKLSVTGKLTGEPGIPITGYSVYVIPGSGTPIPVKINAISSGGSFTFNEVVPAGVQLYVPIKVRVVTNRQKSSEITITKACDAVRFKNRWRSTFYLNIEKGKPEASPVQPAFLSAQWAIVPVAGTKFVRLQSLWKTDQFLNIEKGPLESSNVPAAFYSSQWEIEPVVGGDPGYVRIKNRWRPDQYLNVEKGYLECSAVPLSFQSANWKIEK